MRIVSLHQPWASMVSRGIKLIETRSWPFPGPVPAVLAIHAARYDRRHLSRLVAASSPEFQDAADRAGLNDTNGLPSGAVVCVVRVAECVGTAFLDCINGGLPSLAGRYLACRPQEQHVGNFATGRYCWVFDRVEHFAPVPERGHQKLWRWEPGALETFVRSKWGVPQDGRISHVAL